MQELGIKIEHYTLSRERQYKENKKTHVKITATAYQEKKLLKRLKDTGLMVKIEFYPWPEEDSHSPNQNYTKLSQKENLEMKGN